MRKKQKDLLSIRSSGVLVHPTSLVSEYGCGDIGKSARWFLGFLKKSGFSWWQMLPINPQGEGECPYASTSAFAGEPLLISIEDLVDEGFLLVSDLKSKARLIDRAKKLKSSSKINFSLARKIKEPLFELAFDRFLTLFSKRSRLKNEYLKFIKDNKFWIHDYVLFSSISKKYRSSSWNCWPVGLKNRDKTTIKEFLKNNKKDIDFEYFKQFIFFRQWMKLKKLASSMGICLMGDIPIFVSWTSCDCWANKEFFHLDRKDQTPTLLSGAPPDNFSSEGQLWGSPIYNWKAMKKDGFSWWILRFIHNKKLFDSTRIDHFIGFYHLWVTDSKYKSAKYGKYLPSLGRELFEKLFKLGNFSLVAEDLGQLCSGVEKLRDDFNLQGMRVAQFGFSLKNSCHYHHPDFYPSRSVAYIGTHDMSTATGWIKWIIKDKSTDLKRLLGYLGIDSLKNLDIKTIHMKLIHMLLQTRSNVVIFQLQDLLGLDDSAKTNTPGTTKGNWIWKLNLKDMDKLNKMSGKLACLIHGSCR